MSEKVLQTDERLNFSEDEAVKHGKTVGEILRHASVKYAEVADLNSRIKREKDSIHRTSLEGELAKQASKLQFRTLQAEAVASSNLGIRVNVAESDIVVEGLLVSVNTASSVVKLRDSSGETFNVIYAERQPVPEELRQNGQTYYGTKLVVEFEVTSVPIDNVRVLR